jgi:hypothetical protein
VRICVGVKLQKRSAAVRSARGCLNDALYPATHLPFTSNVGPTARLFFRYVDVVRISQWVVLPETDGRLIVVVVNSQQDLVSLSIIYAGKGCRSVYD